MIAHASIISESEVSITILCLLCSARYTAVRIKNCSKSMSMIKVATARNTIVPRVPQLPFETEVSIALLCQLCSTCYTAVRIKKCLKSTSVLKGTYSGMPKGTSRAEAMLNSEKIKPVALTVIELR